MHKSNHNDTKKQSTSHIGGIAEEVAKQFLLKQGFVFIQSHYRVKGGEIDLIMKDKSDIVFIEVRYRKYLHFGEPVETITLNKQRRLIHTALCYQKTHPWIEHYSLRFDVIGIYGSQLDSKITWIPNAFGVQ